MGERQEFSNTQNWHNRGYLPHYEAANKYQMVTYRLADSLPQEVLKRLEKSLAGSADGSSANNNAQNRKLIETYLDQGYGSCILRIPQVAKLITENWHFFDKNYYDLISYVVMPNHVHILIKTNENFTLSKIVKSWKSYSSHEIKKFLKNNKDDKLMTFKDEEADEPSALPGKEFANYHSVIPKKIWQEEYWDRFIRDEIHFQKCVAYILENPVKAGLVKNWQEWNWRFVRTSKE